MAAAQAVGLQRTSLASDADSASPSRETTKFAVGMVQSKASLINTSNNVLDAVILSTPTRRGGE
jgi:hypothetical protein